jgi:hypothetical protein
MPVPVPQGSVTNPFLGLLGSLIEGSLTLFSFETAVPAILADLADVASAGNAVTRMYFSHARHSRHSPL